MIGALVEEVQTANDRQDFVLRHSQALKEARQTNYWLRLLVGLTVMSEQIFEPLVTESTEIMKIFGAITVRSARSTE